MTSIKEIGFQETFTVRHPVLRSGKPIESCLFKDDELPTTKHFGLFENGELIGVASLFEEKCNFFQIENQIQLRGMAILNSHQQKGFGEKLLHFCEAYLKKENKSLLWFNAREYAVPFYIKLGFQVIGDSFEIDGIGTHILMYKKIVL